MGEPKKICFKVSDINLEFEDYQVKRNVDIDGVIATIKKNSPVLVKELIRQEWTFSFRNFNGQGEDITNVFFFVDVDERKIYFNNASYVDDEQLNHFVSYAIIYTCDYYLLRNSFAEHYLFEAMMVTYFSAFCEVAFDGVFKMCETFAMFGAYDDTLLIKFSYEYSSPYKFLYEAYALIVDENESIKEKCPGLYEVIHKTYFE